MPLYFPSSSSGGGGGGVEGVEYRSDAPILIPGYSTSGFSTVDTDTGSFFTPKESVQIDGLWFWRRATTAANTYVGIYDTADSTSTWTLVTDAAVSTNTTNGLQTVSITPVTLLPTKLYAFIINTSAGSTIAGGAPLVAGQPGQLFGIPPADRTNANPGPALGGGFTKTRTAAALPASFSTSSVTTSATLAAYGGFIKV